MAFTNTCPSSVEFQDFDDEATYSKLTKSARSQAALNFILDFDEKHASCAFNVGLDGFREVVDARNHDVDQRKRNNRGLDTRWINIWCPEKQKDIVKLLADRYGFSPRLALSMYCDPLKPQRVDNFMSTYESRYDRVKQVLHNRSWQPYYWSQVTTHGKLSSDEESNDTPDVRYRMLDLNHYRIVNDVWHFTSVDRGHHYTSIGYNQLYETKARIDLDDAERMHGKPEGRRIWSWTVLCDDNTIISINENPFPSVELLDEHQQRELDSIRHNMLNVFTQVSNVTDRDEIANPIMAVQVRSGRKTSLGESQLYPEDSPSLLMFYLFDDWYTSYSLVAKSDHEYRRQLNTIRWEMFQSAQLYHVHKLHSLGRQLAVLKRMYEGYNLIIDRVIQGPQQASEKPLRPGFSLHTDHESTNSRSSLVEVGRIQAEGYGVPVTAAAAIRFERLKDRITLYALSEIGSCLDEKESLMAMVSRPSAAWFRHNANGVEFQLDCYQGRVLCGEVDPHHYPPCKIHHPVHPP